MVQVLDFLKKRPIWHGKQWFFKGNQHQSTSVYIYISELFIFIFIVWIFFEYEITHHPILVCKNMKRKLLLILISSIRFVCSIKSNQITEIVFVSSLSYQSYTNNVSTVNKSVIKNALNIFFLKKKLPYYYYNCAILIWDFVIFYPF